MENNEKEKIEIELAKEEEDKKEKMLSQKGGLYSKIPKNEKSIKGATILIIFFGLAFLVLIILGIALQC